MSERKAEPHSILPSHSLQPAKDRDVPNPFLRKSPIRFGWWTRGWFIHTDKKFTCLYQIQRFVLASILQNNFENKMHFLKALEFARHQSFFTASCSSLLNLLWNDYFFRGNIAFQMEQGNLISEQKMLIEKEGEGNEKYYFFKAKQMPTKGVSC